MAIDEEKEKDQIKSLELLNNLVRRYFLITFHKGQYK